MQTQPELTQTPNRSRINTHTLVSMAMLCAISLVLTYVCRFVPKVQGILSFDLKDAVVVIGGFLFGPLPALAITVISALIEMVTFSTTGPTGLIMNIISTGAFACTAAAIYKRKRTMAGAVSGLVTGVVAMTVAMLLWNFLITPIYMEVPRAVVTAMLPTVFLPFNLVKGGINAALVMLLYKPVGTALRKARLAPESPSNSADAQRRFGVGHVIAALFVLVTLVLLALVMMGVLKIGG